MEAWFWSLREQVCRILGIRDIRLGPSLPAFITPNILKVLVDKFNIMPITTPDQDLSSILN